MPPRRKRPAGATRSADPAIPLALTFDDVLLLPARSTSTPARSTSRRG
jgi:IMP dehydrogenase/GMP reductase